MLTENLLCVKKCVREERYPFKRKQNYRGKKKKLAEELVRQKIKKWLVDKTGRVGTKGAGNGILFLKVYNVIVKLNGSVDFYYYNQ